jgi:hypothetical protein
MAEVDVRTIRTIVRNKMDRGGLPRQRPEKTLGSYGAGEPCTACDMPIAPEQLQWSLLWSRKVVTHRFHVACHRLWEAECRRRGDWLN